MSWYDLLMRPDSELRKFGLPAKKIAEIREQFTGHRRSLIPRWCRSIGLWGRVATQVEIEYITGTNPKAARRFSDNWGLHFAGHHGNTSQFHLAAKVYETYLDTLDEGEPYNPVKVARQHHILPIEAVLYPLAMRGFCDDREAEDLYALTQSFSNPATLAEMWVNSGWVVALPNDVLRDIGGGDDELAKRIHRRHGRLPTTKLRRTPRSSSSS